MGANNTKCLSCNEIINISDKKCPKCNAVNVRYVDENIELNSDDYLKVKNNFIHYNLLNIEKFLIYRIDDSLHKKIFNIAHLYYITWIKNFARVSGREIPNMSLTDLKDTLKKIYIRYYNVYTKGLMPPGKVRIDPDLTGQNFKNRMALVMKDMDIYIPDLDTVK